MTGCAGPGRPAMIGGDAEHDPRVLRRGRRRGARQGVARRRGGVVHLRAGARADRAGGGGVSPISASAAATWCSPRCAARRTTCSPGSRSAYVGSILVTANPRSAAGGAGRAGRPGAAAARGHRSRPRRRDGGRARLGRRRGGRRRPRCSTRRRAWTARARRGPDDAAVLIPTSGTTGRSKLVTQTHRAYVMAGEGFPWWMELRPDDRLMTSLPLFHINAPAYSMLGSVGARASLALLPALLGERLPRLRAAPRRDRVQRHRGDARDPHAPARAPRRRRQSAAAVLHRPGAAGAAPARDRGPLRPRIVCGYAHVGDALRHRSGRAAPAPSARSAASASTRRSGTSTRAA